MKSFGVTSVVLLTLILASPSAAEAQVLQPSELCSDHADAAIATFDTHVEKLSRMTGRCDLPSYGTLHRCTQ